MSKDPDCFVLVTGHKRFTPFLEPETSSSFQPCHFGSHKQHPQIGKLQKRNMPITFNPNAVEFTPVFSVKACGTSNTCWEDVPVPAPASMPVRSQFMQKNHSFSCTLFIYLWIHFFSCCRRKKLGPSLLRSPCRRPVALSATPGPACPPLRGQDYPVSIQDLSWTTVT